MIHNGTAWAPTPITWNPNDEAKQTSGGGDQSTNNAVI